MGSLNLAIGRLPRWQTAGFCLVLVAIIGVAD
jgi:hypothetical protein